MIGGNGSKNDLLKPKIKLALQLVDSIFSIRLFFLLHSGYTWELSRFAFKTWQLIIQSGTLQL